MNGRLPHAVSLKLKAIKIDGIGCKLIKKKQLGGALRVVVSHKHSVSTLFAGDC